MAYRYPEFHGNENEDVEDFLENMELACITNHVDNPDHILRLFQIFLKDGAREWLKEFEAKEAGSCPS